MAQPIRQVDNANIQEIFKQAVDENAAIMGCMYYWQTRLGASPEQSLINTCKWVNSEQSVNLSLLLHPVSKVIPPPPRANDEWIDHL